MAKTGEIRLLVENLEEAFRRRAWHGTNLMGALRGLGIDEALRRPAPGRHNIWELAVHCGYWKYAVWRRLTGAPKGAFPLPGSNFFPREQGTMADWRSDLGLLRRCHLDLLRAVEAVPPGRLARRPAGSKFTTAQVIRGAAAHDLYHAGQIQLLKRLAR